MTAKEFFDLFDEFFTKLWNWLYDLVCEEFREDPKDDYYVDTMFPEEE